MTPDLAWALLACGLYSLAVTGFVLRFIADIRRLKQEKEDAFWRSAASGHGRNKIGA